MTLLTAARANVGAISTSSPARTPAPQGTPENLRLVLHPTMVHAKVIVGDGEWVDLGSTNFTRLSHGGYEEVDVFCRDRVFARRVEQAVEHELRAGRAGAATARLPALAAGLRVAGSAPFRGGRSAPAAAGAPERRRAGTGSGSATSRDDRMRGPHDGQVPPPAGASGADQQDQLGPRLAAQEKSATPWLAAKLSSAPRAMSLASRTISGDGRQRWVATAAITTIGSSAPAASRSQCSDRCDGARATAGSPARGSRSRCTR